LINVKLTDVKRQELVWFDRLKHPASDLLEIDSQIVKQIVEQAHASMMTAHIDDALVKPLPNLSSYGLFLGALNLMHRAHLSEFARAFALLDELSHRHPKHPIPKAWMAKWYVLKVAQGFSDSPSKDAELALNYCSRALDDNPSSALALSITGQVHGYLKQDLIEAESFYRNALNLDPNESLAWLWLGTNGAFQGQANASFDFTERALALSPLDPISYYYKSLSASAAITAGRYERAIDLACQSIRLNKTHSSTYRALAIARVLSGQINEARATIRLLQQLEPSLTVSKFKARYPGRTIAPGFTDLLADALTQAGLPK
jgi:tetratricopeptide (TPR) repeat protein